MTKTHVLKTWPEEFKAVVSGEKTHEWRRDDRPFSVGDDLLLEEFEPCPKCNAKGGECCSEPHGVYTGRLAKASVTYITRSPGFGIPDGWLVMSVSVKKLDDRDPRSRPLPGDIIVGAGDIKKARVLAIINDACECDSSLGPLPHVESMIDRRDGQRTRTTMSLESWIRTFARRP